jgi:hypothetical protein
VIQKTYTQRLPHQSAPNDSLSIPRLHITPKKLDGKWHEIPIFLAEGIIEKFPGNVLPEGVLTAMTNNSLRCLLVPEEKKT